MPARPATGRASAVASEPAPGLVDGREGADRHQAASGAWCWEDARSSQTLPQQVTSPPGGVRAELPGNAEIPHSTTRAEASGAYETRKFGGY